MKVAICFYGQPRKYKQVLSQWQVIIDELQADVFIHTWYGVDRGRTEIDTNQLITDFHPKEIRISNPHKFTELIPEDAKYENQSYHAMQQAYSMTNSIKLMEVYSNDFGKKYDVTIKCRMDIELHNVISFIEFVKASVDSMHMYVAGNHWVNDSHFDDNIMVSNTNVMKTTTTGFFDYTIKYIRDTKIIPGGENNLFNYIATYSKLLHKIVKATELNFNLLVYNKGENMILNQNNE